MRLTNHEIVFLTSVSRGRVPLGVAYQLPKQDEKEFFMKETVRSLVKKGILDEEEKLTKEGTALLWAWEQYRNSSTHIRLNHVTAAVLPGDALVTVMETEEGCEAACMRSELLMTELLKQSEYLRRGEEKPERGRWQDISGKEWKEKLEESDDAIYLAEYHSGRLVSEKVYFWKGQKGYLFHKSQGRIRELSPGVMRRQIYRALKGSEADGR